MNHRERVLAGNMMQLAPALGGGPVQARTTSDMSNGYKSNRPTLPQVFPAIPVTPRPRLGLVMILKDEAAVIGRCLDSVVHLIGWWTIVDTGSTDDTVAIVESKLGHLPGTLYRRPWRDFGWNRSEAVALARGTADYLLLLDADHVVITEDFDPGVLTADCYTIEVRGALTYEMPYLVQGDREWYYRGKTHEYITCDGSFARESLRTLAVDHFGDGGTRHEKFTRDLVLLEESLLEQPDDARTLFYLAQTRQNLGDAAGALVAYRRRIEVGGWDEEIFWSLYQCGVLLAQRGDWGHAQQALLAAYEYRPSRAEPLYKLAQCCRQRGEFNAAAMFATRASAIPKPADLLFVESWVYEWAIEFELALCLIFTGDLARGLEITERLLAGSRLPEGHRTTLAEHARLYRQAIEERTPPVSS